MHGHRILEHACFWPVVTVMRAPIVKRSAYRLREVRTGVATWHRDSAYSRKLILHQILLICKLLDLLFYLFLLSPQRFLPDSLHLNLNLC